MPYIGNTTSDFSIDTGNITNRAVTATKLSPSSVGSNGQVLSVDGSGNLQWSADASGTALTGSTNNTITTVTGANAIQGEANLTFDGTTLKVSGGSNTTQAIFSGTGGSGARGLEIVTESVGAADEGVIFNARASGSTGRLKFNTNGATAMTILGNGGNIGIGTTNPSFKLQIQGTDNAGSGLYLYNGTGAEGIKIVPESNGNCRIYSSTADILTFGTDSTDRITIAGDGSYITFSGGDFGFGAFPGGTPAGKNVFIAIGDSDTGIVQDGDGQLELWANATEVANINAIDGYTSTKRVYTTGTGRFGTTRINSTTESADTAFDDLVIGDYSGNRGISILSGATAQGAIGFAKSGTTADGYLAYVHNGTATSSAMTLKSQGHIKFNAGSSTKVYIDHNGEVGIGTTNPSATLHCLKSGQINLIVGSSDAGGAYLVLDGDSDGDSSGGDYCYIGHTTDGDLVLAADNPAGNGNIFLKSNGASYQAVGCYESGEVQLRYQNTTKLETSSTGVILTSGAANTTSVRFGNTANRGLYISTYQSAGNNDSGVVFNAADSENNGYAATLEFDLGGVEFGRFDGNYDIFKLGSACNGITFNGDWAATNRLNDYEEGTWTPGIGTTSGSSVTGEYRKIGNVVHIQMYVSIPSHSNSSTMSISGLPFSSIASRYASFTIGNFRFFNHDGGYTTLRVNQAGTTMTFRETGDSQSWQNAEWSQVQADFAMYVSGTYFTS